LLSVKVAFPEGAGEHGHDEGEEEEKVWFCEAHPEAEDPDMHVDQHFDGTVYKVRSLCL
jgi:hypothetical protein